MSTWSDERRADRAAEAEQRRKDKDAEARRHREDRAAEDARRRDNAAVDRAARRAERLQRRRDRRDRRRERAQAWARNTTPAVLYRRGTLALVTASALASLPAQVAHFVGVSMMLLPLPFALEGAAWVMAAGVAYADERKLAPWVRWLLRALSMGAAGYAAHINYAYGSQRNASVAWGLAGVTVMGPLVFEIRQWVRTLSVSAADPKKADAKARRKHDKRRYKDHKDVVKLARKLVSAAPFGALGFEEAFAAAWEIKYGTRTPGMTPQLHGQARASKQALAAAFSAANGSPESVRARLLEVLHPAPIKRFSVTGSSQVVTDLPPSAKKAPTKGEKGSRRQPPPHRRTKGDALPFHPIARTEAAIERGADAQRVAAVNGTRLTAVNGTHH